jgi:hypothetical protein
VFFKSRSSVELQQFFGAPAETCAAVRKGRRHFFVFLLVLFSGPGVEARENLPGDEKHNPTEHDDRADEEEKTVGAVAEHLLRGVAHGNAKNGGSEEREEQNRGEVGGMH